MLQNVNVATAENLGLEELVSLLDSHHKATHDYVQPLAKVEMTSSGLITFPDGGAAEYVPNEVMHQHFAQKLKIPTPYYRRMLNEHPELLSYNVNKWLEKASDDEKAMIRTFEFANGSKVGRALLSDRYNVLDNFDILMAALETIKRTGIKVDIRECSITEKRMYVHIVSPEVEVQTETALRTYLRSQSVGVGYGICSGLVISNSEVGHGRFSIYPRMFIKVCMNGAVIEDDKFAKTHIGAKLDEGAINWSDRVRRKNIEMMMLQAEELVEHFLSKDYLSGKVQKLERAAGQKLDLPHDTVNNVVKELSKDISFDKESVNRILNYFTGDGDNNASGVFQALTREAQNRNADDRYDLERKAFSILPKIKSFDKPFQVGNN